MPNHITITLKCAGKAITHFGFPLRELEEGEHYETISIETEIDVYILADALAPIIFDSAARTIRKDYMLCHAKYS